VCVWGGGVNTKLTIGGPCWLSMLVNACMHKWRVPDKVRFERTSQVWMGRGESAPHP
jgi:hypothetical protein